MECCSVVGRFLSKSIFLFVLVCGSVSANESGLEVELIKLHKLYDEVQNTDEWKPKAKLAKKFGQGVKWSGISNEGLFDRVESDLFKNNIKYTKKTRGKYIEVYSWMVQALAYSGLEKYKGTIEKFTDKKKFESKIVRHAERSLEVIDDFARWNPSINRDLEGVSYEQLEKSRNINLINSEIPQLQRVGARLAIEQFKSDSNMEVMDLIEQRLLVLFTQTGGDRMKLDTASWMCRALGLSGNSRYIATLEKVRAESSDRAVIKWAAKALLQITGVPATGSRR